MAVNKKRVHRQFLTKKIVEVKKASQTPKFHIGEFICAFVTKMILKYRYLHGKNCVRKKARMPQIKKSYHIHEHREWSELEIKSKFSTIFSHQDLVISLTYPKYTTSAPHVSLF